MDNANIISGTTEDEVWQQINGWFLANPDPLEYTAIIEQEKRKIVLDIDIDLGGGFESGFETTTLTAELKTASDFRFAIHEQHFSDEIGKFFGMEDVEIGYDEFDKKLIVKTNDPIRVKEIFSDESIRKVFESLSDFTFAITDHNTNNDRKAFLLELQIESAITNPATLREIYHAFYAVLFSVDKELTL